MSKNQFMSTPGKVIHDTRGNAIWDWTIETAVLARATVDELLNRLIDPVALDWSAMRNTTQRGAAIRTTVPAEMRLLESFKQTLERAVTIERTPPN